MIEAYVNSSTFTDFQENQIIGNVREIAVSNSTLGRVVALPGVIADILIDQLKIPLLIIIRIADAVLSLFVAAWTYFSAPVYDEGLSNKLKEHFDQSVKS